MLAVTLLFSLALPYTLASPTLGGRQTTATCGAKGWDNGIPAYTSSSTATDAVSCSALCVADANCNSYGVGTSGCLLYTTTVANNHVNDPNSPWTFYDKSCDPTAPIPTSTTTTSTFVIPTPTGTPTCGVAGFDKGTPAAFWFDGSASAASYTGCLAVCQVQGCYSFGYSATACLLYKAFLDGNLTPSPGSPYIFYDAACPAPGSATTTAQTTFQTSTSVRPDCTASATALPTPSAGATCGNVTGGTTATEAGWTDGANINDCALDCNLFKCASFGYSKGAGLCAFYQSAVSALNVDSTSGDYAFYDEDCFQTNICDR